MDWYTATCQKAETNTFNIPDRWVFLRYYEAFNLLFRIENALRVYVYTVLKNEYRDKWADIQISVDESTPTTISAVAKKRMAQAGSYGYLGHTIVCPIMHLTSGELTRLIVEDSYWKLFKEHFRGSKEIIRTKLEEIGTIRNSLAHFRPIKDDDVTAIKHNAKHILMGVEQYLAQVLRQPDVVPTNTDDQWYKELKILKSDLCTFSFHQSADANWIRVPLTYKPPILGSYKTWSNSINYNVLSLNSSAVLTNFSQLTATLTYLTENLPFLGMPEDFMPKFTKTIHFVFSRSLLAREIEHVREDLANLLTMITEESALIQQDNLARGRLIHAVRTSARPPDEKPTSMWNINVDPFQTPVDPDDPPEYWGNFWGYSGDFIAATTRYPWMPEPIAELVLPF